MSEGGIPGRLLREIPYVVVVGLVVLMLVGSLAQRGREERAPEVTVEEPIRLPEVEPGTRQGVVFQVGATLHTGALLVGLVLLALGVRQLARGKALLGPEARVVAELRPAGWNLWDVVKIAALYFVLANVLSAALVGRVDYLRTPRFWVADSSARLIAVGFLLGLVRERGHDLGQAGLTAGRAKRQAKIAALAYLGFLPVFWAVMALQTAAAAYLDVKPTQQESIKILFQETRPGLLAAVVIAAVVVAPFTEELFFRGFLLPWMRKRLGSGLAIAGSAFVFALVHPNVTAFVPMLLLALVLGYLYERTRSLLAPILVHTLHNGCIIAAVFWVRYLRA